jgi:hypothetical protein
MKYLTLLFIITIATMTANAQNFESHQWKNRLLLVLSKDGNSEIFRKQLEALNSDKSGLAERKLLIYKILPENQKTPNKDSTWIYNSELYNYYSKKEETFKVILIGLDGGIKKTQNSIVNLEDLYATIDGMPMRRSEIKSNKN